PMTVRFFMAQSHYRSTLDFSNEALQAAEKGYRKLMESLSTLEKIEPSNSSSVNISELEERCYAAMNDDFNSPVLIAHLFDAVRIINSTRDHKETLSPADLQQLTKVMHTFIFDVLGLVDETRQSASSEVIEGLMSLILDIRKRARDNKDWATSDQIRERLKAIGIEIKDTREGIEWSM
ncbi:MAG: Cysteine--tRNA ligase, partial [Proteiniphilum sp. 51_7]